MANLRELRDRVVSIKSTQKITKAMQVVSASKLRQAKLIAEKSLYAKEGLDSLTKNIIDNISEFTDPSVFNYVKDGNSHKIISGNKDLYIVFAGQRGLCGGFNSSIAKALDKKLSTEYNVFDKNHVEQNNINDEGNINNKKDFAIITVGAKAYSLLKNKYGNKIIEHFDIDKSYINEISSLIKDKIINMVNDQGFSNCYLYFNKFKNALLQEMTITQLLPISGKNFTSIPLDNNKENKQEVQDLIDNGSYEIESHNDLFTHFISTYISYNISYSFASSVAGEEGARMSAMDNATRNADDLINQLTLSLNRSRQAIITTELTEIISGAEAIN
ncbi:MAG TPA: ATP synthase F1 subunit gamma [Candidatus Megaira endosymbiont of Hartmannula sinica]|nr:ATP synthase F1 subunit gamma [Candidatus Megaera endosymbiont of Hartmannula sinica]